MRSIFEAEAAANRVLDRDPECTQEDVKLAQEVGLIEFLVDVDGYYASPTEAYINLMELKSVADFSGLGDLRAWVVVLQSHFEMSEMDAIVFLGKHWPANAEKPLATTIL